VSILQFTHNGTTGLPETQGGLVTGDIILLLNPAPFTQIEDDFFFNELLIPFTSFGTSISFTVVITENASGSGQVPDEFSFFILGANRQPLFSSADPLDADSLFAISVNGTTSGLLEPFDPTKFTPPNMLDIPVPGASVTPLALASLTLPTAEVEVGYDAPLITGGLAPYTFTLVKGTFPPGLSGNTSNGHLVGIPTAKKTGKFTVKITDALNASVTGAFIAKILGALDITTKSLKAGTHDKPYKATLKAKNGSKPFTWSLAAASGPLASGLGLDPLTGVISGTTAQIGTFNITVQVTDPTGGVDQQDLSLTIK
jgi:hypothetical protein